MGEGSCCDTRSFLRGESRSRDASVVEGGGIGLSQEDQRSGEEWTDFRQEGNRAHLPASEL